MREIKFRAWDKMENKMYYEGFIIYPKSGMCEFPWYGNELHENVEDPHTFILQQYTGLHDKDGKEIYEGDIIKCIKKNIFKEWKEFIGVVKWDVNGYWKITNDKEWVNAGTFSCLKDIKIVGNIYDNPELIGGKDERN